MEDFFTQERLNDETLLWLNSEGLIPGPEEGEENFIIRAKSCLKLKEELNNNLDLPFKDAFPHSLPNDVLNDAYPLTKPLYGIAPTWIPLFFSNYRLAPWHGGSAWIFQLKENGPRLSLLQLRKAFATQKKYLGIYPRDELIAHECAHIGRMAYNEERFEELLAYRCSRSKFRAWFSPIIQSAQESFLFVAILAIIFCLDLYFLMTINDDAYRSVFPLKGLPLLLLAFALVRLLLKHRTFNRCLDKLTQITGSKEKANHLIYRLSDKEIIDFSKLDSAAIMAYAHDKSPSSLRWRLLNIAYLQDI